MPVPNKVRLEVRPAPGKYIVTVYEVLRSLQLECAWAVTRKKRMIENPGKLDIKLLLFGPKDRAVAFCVLAIAWEIMDRG